MLALISASWRAQIWLAAAGIDLGDRLRQSHTGAGEADRHFRGAAAGRGSAQRSDDAAHQRHLRLVLPRVPSCCSPVRRARDDQELGRSRRASGEMVAGEDLCLDGQAVGPDARPSANGPWLLRPDPQRRDAFRVKQRFSCRTSVGARWPYRTTRSHPFRERRYRANTNASVGPAFTRDVLVARSRCRASRLGRFPS